MEAEVQDRVSVNQVVDLKGPLKGKGGSLAQWRSDAQDRLAQVYRAMDLLAAETKSIEGRTFGLNVYALRTGRQLRWRMTNSKHAIWDRIQPLLKSLPQGLAQWYVKAEEVAQILNHQEQVVRFELKTVNRLISGGLREPKPFRGEVVQGVGSGRSPVNAKIQRQAARPL